jgi:hypothetical protein
MKVRTALIGACTLAAALGGGLALAPAASAGSNEFQESLSGSDPVFNRWDDDGCPSDTNAPDEYHYRVFDLIVTAPGDYEYYDIGYEESVPGTIDVEVGIYEAGTFDPADPGAAGCIDTMDDDATFTIPSAGTYTLVLTTNDSIDDGDSTGLGYWSITGPGMAYLNSAPIAGQEPPAWYQAYARAGADVACDAGWKPSYAEWPNGGKGGWTCERALVYSNTTGKWAVDLGL